MFDIGFLELMTISVIALLVIGPERLPTVARQAGRGIAKVKRFTSSISREFEKIAVEDDLKASLKDTMIMEENKECPPSHERVKAFQHPEYKIDLEKVRSLETQTDSATTPYTVQNPSQKVSVGVK